METNETFTETSPRTAEAADKGPRWWFTFVLRVSVHFVLGIALGTLVGRLEPLIRHEWRNHRLVRDFVPDEMKLRAQQGERVLVQDSLLMHVVERARRESLGVHRALGLIEATDRPLWILAGSPEEVKLEIERDWAGVTTVLKNSRPWRAATLDGALLFVDAKHILRIGLYAGMPPEEIESDALRVFLHELAHVEDALIQNDPEAMRLDPRPGQLDYEAAVMMRANQWLQEAGLPPDPRYGHEVGGAYRLGLPVERREDFARRQRAAHETEKRIRSLEAAGVHRDADRLHEEALAAGKRSQLEDEMWSTLREKGAP